MKIGILTLPFNNNYGGYLQAYALMTALKDMGHSPTIILRRNNLKKCTKWFYLKNILKSIIYSISHLDINILFHPKEIYFLLRGRKMIPFVNKYIQPQTDFLYSTKELCDVCRNKFDAFIVGSDQVWRPEYVPDIGNFFLDFTNGWNVRRIAYAASFGNSNPLYTDREKKSCGDLAARFNAISIREKSGLDIITRFKWKVKNKAIVLDPTMLLSKEKYLSLLPSKKSKTQNKVFCYILDEEYEINNLINRLCNLLEKERYDFFYKKLRTNTHTALPSIEEWLMNIRDAEYIVTDSFHGMVFSILFNKKFFVYYNSKRGNDRFESLLEYFGLRKCIINDLKELESAYKVDINWTYVNNKIEDGKRKSINFLNSALL